MCHSTIPYKRKMSSASCKPSPSRWLLEPATELNEKMNGALPWYRGCCANQPRILNMERWTHGLAAMEESSYTKWTRYQSARIGVLVGTYPNVPKEAFSRMTQVGVSFQQFSHKAILFDANQKVRVPQGVFRQFSGSGFGSVRKKRQVHDESFLIREMTNGRSPFWFELTNYFLHQIIFWKSYFRSSTENGRRARTISLAMMRWRELENPRFEDSSRSWPCGHRSRSFVFYTVFARRKFAIQSTTNDHKPQTTGVRYNVQLHTFIKCDWWLMTKAHQHQQEPTVLTKILRFTLVLWHVSVSIAFLSIWEQHYHAWMHDCTSLCITFETTHWTESNSHHVIYFLPHSSNIATEQLWYDRATTIGPIDAAASAESEPLLQRLSRTQRIAPALWLFSESHDSPSGSIISRDQVVSSGHWHISFSESNTKSVRKRHLAHVSSDTRNASIVSVWSKQQKQHCIGFSVTLWTNGIRWWKWRRLHCTRRNLCSRAVKNNSVFVFVCHWHPLLYTFSFKEIIITVHLHWCSTSFEVLRRRSTLYIVECKIPSKNDKRPLAGLGRLAWEKERKRFSFHS